MFLPRQLMYLCECVKKTKEIPGCIVEAGCAYGDTTIFLKKYMQEEGIDKQYIAIDTFSGFVEEHVDHEIKMRGKPDTIHNHFFHNKKQWYDFKLRNDGITDVTSVESDVMKFDFKAVGPIAFCLLDVDLYLPIRDVLPKIYDALSPGGIIIVDDCTPDKLWDGAFQAYREFVTARRLSECVVLDKLGVIQKL
jgi:SAM-dependent methyltransferase